MNTLARLLQTFFFVTVLLILQPGLLAETPTITISKGEAISVKLTGISGSGGAAATKILRNDLALSGLFKITEGGAGYVISGVARSGALEGKVVDSAGRNVLVQTFSGSARGKVHAFADAIVEVITGKPGIALSKIAFVATKTGRKEIYVADYDGSGVKQLTRDGSISVAPALSVDGKRLAYTGYKSGYADVYSINLNSGARKRIIKYPGTNSGAAFSPSGGKLAVTLSKDGNPELYVTSAGGGSARRLTRTRGVESSPTWSPDGREIIYSSDDRGGPQLYRVGAGGGRSKKLATGHGYCTEPSWSPDGRKVAFTVRSGGGFRIATLDLGSGSVRLLGTGEDPCWGANSRHLIYSNGSAILLVDTKTGRKTKVISGLGRATEPTWSR